MPSSFNIASAQEPSWLLEIPRQAPISPLMRQWITDTGSLTKRLIQTCEADGFRVDLLEQRWHTPLPSEQKLLKTGEGEQALIRQVKLMCAEDFRVYARTVIPAQSIDGKARHLSELQNKPLGAVLFSDPRTRRVEMQFAALEPGHYLHTQTMLHAPAVAQVSLWGRRTLFLYDGHPLVVNEIFMPVMETVEL